jgi:molybdate/tungstate transport system substrate-binding protein
MSWLRRSRSVAPLGFALLLATPLLAGPRTDRSVSVLYAASISSAMERTIGPAFTRATGIQFNGEARGSLGAARMIRDHQRQPDVFISADPLVYSAALMGPQNGNHVRWFITLGSSEMVLGYDPDSKFAEKFRQAQMGKIPWYEALATVGVRFGRADPTIDPKGYRTLFLFHLAAQFYHRPELWSLLGDPMNPEQAFPEVGLVERLRSGQLDAAVFYKHEMIAEKLPFIALPKEINLGDPDMSEIYSRETYVTSWGEHVHGAPIIFTVTIPDTAARKEAAGTFVRFLLSSDDLWKQLGFGMIEHKVGGESGTVPIEIRSLTTGLFRP